MTAEFYNCAVEVMRGAEAIDEYIALPQQEAFDIEYWLLEEAKLKRMPAEKELARQVVIVIGAGSGIGKETAHRLVKEGAHIVCVDMKAEAAEATAKEITDKLRPRHRRRRHAASPAAARRSASRRTSPTAPASARCSIRSRSPTAASITSPSPPASSCRATRPATSPTTSGRSPSASTSPAATSSPTKPRRPGRNRACAATLVLTTSANAAVAKKGSVAYDSSKAAANHLVRELAIELAPLVRVNGVAPATVVQGSAMFPRDRVIGSLAKYNIPYTDDEATESLVQQARAILRRPHADQVARSPPPTRPRPTSSSSAKRLSKTTGQVITVDGGLHEAFLR